MSPKVLRSVTNPKIMKKTQHLIWTLSYDVYRENLRRALYDCHIIDDGSGTLQKVWPALRVHLIWCDMTTGECAWTTAVMHAQYNAANPEHRRWMELHNMEGANYFVSRLCRVSATPFNLKVP